MSEGEIKCFLAGHLTMCVATLRPDGQPHMSTVSYATDADGLVFWSYAKAQKSVNLLRDPRLSCLIEAGDRYIDYRGVAIEGRCSIITDPDEVLAVGRRLRARSAADLPRDPAGDRVRAAAEKRYAFKVHPMRVASWDHRKLGGSY